MRKGLKRVRPNSAFPSGTSLMGYIKTNRTELRKAFGKPNIGASDDGKVKSSGWNLIIDGKVCTIYDRREQGKRGMKYFNIGGRDMFSPLLVAQELSKVRGEKVTAHETVPKWNEEKGFHEQVNSIGEHPIITYDRARKYWKNKSRYRSESFGAEDDNSTTCEDCGVKIGYDEAFDWEGLDRCEDCYDYWMMKDRQNYGGDETDCISCGYSISPNDSRFELVDGLCPDCKDTESFGAELESGEAALRIVLSEGQLSVYHDASNHLLMRRPIYAGEWDKIMASLNAAESFGAEFAGYEDPISERQRYRIRKLGGRIDKAMTRSEASKYIKSLMAMPLHAESTDCSVCEGWGWNEELDMVCDADGCIGGWVVPKKPSLLERGLELGAGMGMGMAGVAILFGLVGGTVGFAAETRKKRRD